MLLYELAIQMVRRKKTAQQRPRGCVGCAGRLCRPTHPNRKIRVRQLNDQTKFSAVRLSQTLSARSMVPTATAVGAVVPAASVTVYTLAMLVVLSTAR